MNNTEYLSFLLALNLPKLFSSLSFSNKIRAIAILYWFFCSKEKKDGLGANSISFKLKVPICSGDSILARNLKNSLEIKRKFIKKCKDLFEKGVHESFVEFLLKILFFHDFAKILDHYHQIIEFFQRAA